MKLFLRALAVGAGAVLIAAGTVGAATIIGTAKNDVLRGTAKADKLYGKAGNDRLLGLAGKDLLVGGPGNDTLVGGPGNDTLQCGPGGDTALADKGDKLSGCEVVKGLPKPALSIGDALVAEGNASATTLSFQVTLSTAGVLPVSVGFATADGSATAPADYAAASGTITFAPGETTKTVDVAVVGETAFEPDETFTVNLSGPSNGTVADASATGTIQNDDKQLPRSGRYAGTTSQGRSISFDVSPDVTSVANLVFSSDVTCTEVPVTVPDLPLDLTGTSFPIAPDLTFGFNVPVTTPEGSINVSLSGMLSLPGNSAGSCGST